MNSEEYAKLSKEEQKKVKFKDLPTANKVSAVIAIGLILLVLFWIFGPSDSEEEDVQEVVTHEQRIQGLFSAWDGSLYSLEKLIKSNMNDPDSYDHVETVFWDMKDHIVVQTKFRGKNAFGGVVLNSIKAKADTLGNVIEILEQN